MSPLFEGILAGYAIAIPVGPIAILIIDRGLRRGFLTGFAAGTGAASADLTYATLAVLAGQVIASVMAPVIAPLRIVSGFALVALGVWGLWGLRKDTKQSDTGDQQEQPAPTQGFLRTYFQFLGLTLVNPLTFVYFATIILSGSGTGLTSGGQRMLFVLGAWLASWSWQIGLAAVAGIARARLPEKFQVYTSFTGNLIVIGLGVRTLVQVLLQAN